MASQTIALGTPTYATESSFGITFEYLYWGALANLGSDLNVVVNAELLAAGGDFDGLGIPNVGLASMKVGRFSAAVEGARGSVTLVAPNGAERAIALPAYQPVSGLYQFATGGFYRFVQNQRRTGWALRIDDGVSFEVRKGGTVYTKVSKGLQEFGKVSKGNVEFAG